jgi:hypothetical protein
MKKFVILFILFFSNSFSQTIYERIERNILKEVSFQNIKVIFSKTGPFIIEKNSKKVFSGGFWLAQGCIKTNDKTKFTHEEWQFNDFDGKLKGEIITETPLTIKIDSCHFAKNSIGFKETLTLIGKTIKIEYEFEIDKNTDYPVNIYINFDFEPEVLNREITPFIDEEKAIYETKMGSIIISYSSEFLPDRFNADLWRCFRISIRFPGGLKKGDKKNGEININLP